MLSAATAHAAETPSIGLASMVQGTVQVKSAKAKDWAALKPGAQVFQGDRVKTVDGTARLTFDDKSVISLAPRSEIELNEFVYKPNATRQSSFKLWGGRMKASISKFFSSNSNVRVSTPTAVAGVRGTEFLVSVEGANNEPASSDTNPEEMTTNVVVFEGSVGVKSLLQEAAQEIALAAGQGTGVGHNAAPTPPANLTPQQLRSAYRSAAASSRGTLRSTVGSSQLQAASADIGDSQSQGLGSSPAIGTPPIQQQPTDAKSPSSLTIRVRVPGQE
jgi:hypothetical protein